MNHRLKIYVTREPDDLPLLLRRLANEVHTNGRGSSFQALIHGWIECLSSATERWVPRRSHSLVSSANHRSIEPGAVGRGEVQVDARMSQQPAANGGCLVGRGVVADHTYVQAGGHLAVDVLQEPFELHRTVTGGHLGDDLAACHLQGGIQVGGAMADVGLEVGGHVTDRGQSTPSSSAHCSSGSVDSAAELGDWLILQP
jgi:hypothetical protein